MLRQDPDPSQSKFCKPDPGPTVFQNQDPYPDLTSFKKENFDSTPKNNRIQSDIIMLQPLHFFLSQSLMAITLAHGYMISDIFLLSYNFRQQMQNIG